ncbi:RNA-binding protein NOB1 [Cucumispora dikerogammari]|nr:RNA-binding protein NOB1 [Cucumispora dikerogammari]
MLDYAILDTNFLLSSSNITINTLFIPHSILKELRTPQAVNKFHDLKRSAINTIYINNKPTLGDKNETFLLIDNKYCLISQFLSKKLNLLCSPIDCEVIAASLYVECFYNKNRLLAELIDSFVILNGVDESQKLTNIFETYTNSIKLDEDKEFYEWKTHKPTPKLMQEIKTELNYNIKCLSGDAGINTIFSFLKLKHLIYTQGQGQGFIEKQFVLRCFTCKTIYKTERLFCRKCGNKTITRVSVRRNENNQLVVNLKKGYKFKEKIIKDGRGREILSEDSRRWNEVRRKK